jgi:cell wall-associated NlpC family hydrolase
VVNATQLARSTRTLLAAALGVALFAVGPPGASAAGPAAPSAAESALRIQAQELAGQIQAEGLQLEQLAESFDAAQLRSQQLTSRLRLLKAGMARSDALVATAQAALKEQALLSYIAGGAPLSGEVSGRPGADPAVTVAYAEIVAGGQHRAVETYRAVLGAQARQSKQLTDASRQAAASLAELQADRTAATQAVTARGRTLDEVQGRLATLVAQDQAAQQRAEQTAVEASLARQDQLPPSTRAEDPTPTPSSRPAATTSTTAVPPSTATRPSLTTPVATSPPGTSPPRPPAPPPTSTPISPPTTAPPAPPTDNVAARGSSIAVRYAYAQLGKPYQWGGAGPASFDCSGLTMMAWAAAGVSLPHLAQDQYDMTTPIPLSDVLPGDLIFFGTPANVYHEGIYIGAGQMIDAPATGLTVSISSIYWVDLLGAGRVVD